MKSYPLHMRISFFVLVSWHQNITSLYCNDAMVLFFLERWNDRCKRANLRCLVWSESGQHLCSRWKWSQLHFVSCRFWWVRFLHFIWVSILKVNWLTPLLKLSWDRFINNEIFSIRYEEDDINKLPESSIRPIARTALTWDQVN